MTEPGALRDKNRRTALILLAIFVALACLAVAFVILRRSGYA